MLQRLVRWNQPRYWFVLVLGLAAVLRLGLATVNRESNDAHYQEIIRPMAWGGAPRTTLSIYHPKLFHRVAGLGIELFGFRSETDRIVFCQWLNALVGILTILLLWRFLSEVGVPDRPKLLALGFFALNP